MPIFDFQCSCGNIEERIEHYDVDTIKCSQCSGESKKIISVSGVFTANEDTPWLKTVLEVVSKDDNSPHVVNFRKNPTRSNYKAWMKGEGIRPLEHPTSQHGEAHEAKQGRLRADRDHVHNMTESIMRHRQERRA